MSSAPSLASVAALPALAAAPLLGGSGATAAVTLPIASGASIAGTQSDVAVAVRLAQATPQELALLAANGNQRAQAILDQAQATRRLVSPVDITV